MPRTYVHLSGKQIDDAILGMYGKKKKEDRLPELSSLTCPRCEKENWPISKFCSRCGLPLDQATMWEIQDVKNGAVKQLDSVLMVEVMEIVKKHLNK